MAITTDTLDNADNAGTLVASTLFAVAQTSAGNKIQQMPRSAMIHAGAITGLDLLNVTKAVTAVAFTATRASLTAVGTTVIATDAKITTGSDATSAISPSGIPALAAKLTAPTLTIVDGWIDGDSTAGTWVMTNLIGINQGTNIAMFNGTITFTPTITVSSAELVLLNTPLPTHAQAGSASTLVTVLRSVGMNVSNVGGKLVLTFGNPVSGGDWVGSTTYTINIYAHYFI